MHASLARRALGGLVPPKIATPKLVSGDSTGPLGPLVAFYSKLPKGPAPQPTMRGLKARYFSGKNASAAPVLALISGIFLIGYTIDYQSASFYLLVLHSLLTRPSFFLHLYSWIKVHLSAYIHTGALGMH
ncbi:mitochondrial F1-F0 ATP synthase subunit F of fungi-domain-containing protein [Mycena capillaripes]|nr:mitochondrial F1-F0 ATP synthase subunit F of fungi-domain-containing protein [Mycena capillaripes]